MPPVCPHCGSDQFTQDEDGYFVCVDCEQRFETPDQSDD